MFDLQPLRNVTLRIWQEPMQFGSGGLQRTADCIFLDDRRRAEIGGGQLDFENHEPALYMRAEQIAELDIQPRMAVFVRGLEYRVINVLDADLSGMVEIPIRKYAPSIDTAGG